MTNFKTKFCWWPVPLARHIGDGMEFIGWVWMTRANLTRNINHGWVCFLDSKPMPKWCSKCGQNLPTPNVEVRGPTAALSPEAPSQLPGSAARDSEKGTT